MNALKNKKKEKKVPTGNYREARFGEEQAR